MQKGGQKKVHKYLSRYYKNGKWFYKYAKDKAGEVSSDVAEIYRRDVTGDEYLNAANAKKENSKNRQELANLAGREGRTAAKNRLLKEAERYGKQAAEQENNYKTKSLKGKAESAIAKGQAKIDKILKSETKTTITSNLMPAGQEKVIKEKVIKENTIPEKKIYEKKTYENGDTINIKELSEKNKKKNS